MLIAASGGIHWGGANVFLSLDGTEYSQIGTLIAPALQATLTAALPAFTGTNPDTTDTLSADATQSLGIWPAGSIAAAQNFSSLAWVSPQPTSSGGNEVLSAAGELLAFGAVSATGTYTANLTTLERGLYGTRGTAHATGEQFTLFDTTGRLGSTLVYDLPAQYIGQTLYLKFQSFNVFDSALEDLSTVTTYEFVPTGASFGSAAAGVPSEPTGFGGIVQSSQVLLTWSANPVNDNVAAYAVYRANGTSTPFTSAALIWSGNTLAYTDTNVNLVTGYTYYLVAINAVGNSLPSSGFNASTAGINDGQVLQTGSFSSVSEAPIDWNPQVAACEVVEITITGVSAATSGAKLLAKLRYSGSDVGTIIYSWVLIQNTPGATTPSGSTGDTSIEISPAITSATDDNGFGTVSISLGTTFQGVKLQYTYSGDDSAGNFSTVIGGGKLNSYPGGIGSGLAPSGISFAMSTGDITLKYAIKGYQI